jgi:hypothetical protein
LRKLLVLEVEAEAVTQLTMIFKPGLIVFESELFNDRSTNGLI